MSRSTLISLAAVLLLGACDQPPIKEIASAQAALDDARANGADVYAPERWAEARGDYLEAQRKLEARDYRGALSAASGAAEKARLASQAADAARRDIDLAVRAMQEEVRARLEEVEALRKEAQDARIPASMFSRVDSQLANARNALAAISAGLEKKDYLAARAAAEAARSAAQSLPETIREARRLWEKEHPAHRRRPGARR
jgi:hypothetical protein